MFLASAELAAIAAIQGELPSVDEYLRQFTALDARASDIYQPLDFDQLTRPGPELAVRS